MELMESETQRNSLTQSDVIMWREVHGLKEKATENCKNKWMISTRNTQLRNRLIFGKGKLTKPLKI